MNYNREKLYNLVWTKPLIPLPQIVELLLLC